MMVLTHDLSLPQDHTTQTTFIYFLLQRRVILKSMQKDSNPSDSTSPSIDSADHSLKSKHADQTFSGNASKKNLFVSFVSTFWKILWRILRFIIFCFLPIPSPRSKSQTPSQDLTAPHAQDQATKNRKTWLIENIVSFFVALAIVFMIRSSLIEAFKIPSGSMMPTLLVGDHIFVNKFAYGLKLPFSDFFTDKPFFLIKRDSPKRGDVIVFLYPENESIHYIKRVIGVAGDSIEVRNKKLYINQQMIDQEVIDGKPKHEVFHGLEDPKYSEDQFELALEHLSPADHQILIDKTSYMSRNFGPRVVPPGNLFVMGDNRDMSNDSRSWGFVPLKNVKGKAIVTWFSLWLSFFSISIHLSPQSHR